MALNAALQIGRTGVLTHQAAIEVTGHNLANVATRGYHRQEILLDPMRADEIAYGVFVGRGVQIRQISRQVDEALEARVRAGVSDEQASRIDRDLLLQIEALQNELSGVDLSTQLSTFFNGWSELANTPDDVAQRSLVAQQGDIEQISLARLKRMLASGIFDELIWLYSTVGLDKAVG